MSTYPNRKTHSPQPRKAPRKDGWNGRTEVVKVRMTTSERDTYTQLAAQQGRTLSGYIRYALSEYAQRTRLNPEANKK